MGEQIFIDAAITRLDCLMKLDIINDKNSYHILLPKQLASVRWRSYPELFSSNSGLLYSLIFEYNILDLQSRVLAVSGKNQNDWNIDSLTSLTDAVQILDNWRLVDQGGIEFLCKFFSKVQLHEIETDDTRFSYTYMNSLYGSAWLTYCPVLRGNEYLTPRTLYLPINQCSLGPDITLSDGMMYRSTERLVPNGLAVYQIITDKPIGCHPEDLPGSLKYSLRHKYRLYVNYDEMAFVHEVRIDRYGHEVWVTDGDCVMGTSAPFTLTETINAVSNVHNQGHDT